LPGPNGAGKTTLFKTILQLLTPLSGTIAIDAERIERWPRRHLARVFGYVPQAQLGLFPFTVRDVVLMGRTVHIDLFATPSAQDIEVAEQMLDLLGVAHLADHPYTEVSGGERQITLVARALAQEPKILVMDEPTASLDFGNQVRVLSEIKGLARRGIAVILSTHDPDQAFLCAQRVAILHQGRLAHLGSPAEVITSENLRSIYGVHVQVQSVKGANDEMTRVCVPSLAHSARDEAFSKEPAD
jgi:iron complex transport system ATP-binding protein